MIGCGNSSMVHLLPCGTKVTKAVRRWNDDVRGMREQAKHLRREVAVYNHLPADHPRFLRLYDSSDDGDFGVSLTLEYMPHGTLHEYLRGYTLRDFWDDKRRPGEAQPDHERRLRRRHDSLPLRLRARWALEAAEGVVVLHAHDIVHCDLRPENMGVDATLGVRIFDLAGCSLGDLAPYLMEDARYCMPRASWDVYNVVTDCFALGSNLYEMVTGFRPYDSLGNNTNDDEIAARYKRGEFPDLSGQTGEDAGKEGDTNGTNPLTGQLLFSGTIRKCWHGEFVSAADVLAALKKEVVQTFGEDDLQWIEKVSGIPLKKTMVKGEVV